jgi:putative two-component system response regulator
MKALVLDDSPTSLSILTHLAEVMALETISLSDPIAAIQSLPDLQFDLALVDYVMPGINGAEVVRSIRSVDRHRDIPVVVVTADNDHQTRLDALTAGATEFLAKPVEPVEFKARIRNLLELRRAQITLNDRAALLANEVAEATKKLLQSEKEVIWHLARAVEFRDGQTGEHISRMAALCRMIAEQLGLDTETCDTIYLAAPLHDVGKIGVSDEVLRKPGSYTPAERAAMEEHVIYGEQILRGGESALLKTARDIVSGHHERWDGKGYPRGLAGELIPLSARIAAVADVFEALVSDRHYKKAWPIERARDFVQEQSGQRFDPDCVSAFVHRWGDIQALIQAPAALPTAA